MMKGKKHATNKVRIHNFNNVVKGILWFSYNTPDKRPADSDDLLKLENLFSKMDNITVTKFN